jgi:lipoate-protein ligase A
MKVVRWMDYGSADGATHMATDMAVAEYAIEIGKPTVRIYRWNPKCISLGYHQKVDNIDLNLCRKDKIEVIRRPTGGRAVFHGDEVTYSIFIPNVSDSLFQGIKDVYHFISRGLIKSLQKLGIPVELQKRFVDLHRHYHKTVSMGCFSATARYEIVVNGKKIVGSAQRRLPWGILQHGSILTGEAHFRLFDYYKGIEKREKENLKKELEMNTMSVKRYLGKEVRYEEIVSALRSGMEEAFSVKFEDGQLTETEKACVHRLRKNFFL